MKINCSNFLRLGLFCLSMLVYPTFANANKADTTLLAENTITQPVAEMTTKLPSNVIYPSSLEESRDQSIEYIRTFSEKRKTYLLSLYKQGKKIFPRVSSVLKQYGLPEELRVLIALESGFNGNAVSRVGAVGYWQIMDDVAKEYGLKISNSTQTSGKGKNKDDRKNFIKSTVAAARYLKDRCRNLNNDLLLIVAAYNWGIGNIWNAMSRSGKTNPTFWDIKKYLPAETRSYVMNFITLNVIFQNIDKFSSHSLVFTPRTVRVVPTAVSEIGAE